MLEGNDKMQLEIQEFFKERKDAFYFLCQYVQYIHCIDDCVDEPNAGERTITLTELAAKTFNSPYWLKYQQNLIIVERLVHNAYFDSVVWENSQEEWKKRDAKVLNQRGYDMIFAVMLIEFGEDKLREFSSRFREYSHKNQGHHEAH